MSKQIAFTALVGSHTPTWGYEQSNWHLYLLDEEEASLRQLTSDLTVGQFSWSPDGQRIAFLSNGYAGEMFTQTLHCIDADGSHLRRLTDEKGGILFTWSPDSRQIALTCFEEDYRSPQRRGEYFLMDLESGGVRQITKEAAYPVWAPGTNEIAFLWGHDKQNIFLMDANGSNRRLLFQSNRVISPPNWSPDGHFLLFNVWSRSHWEPGYKDRDLLTLLDVHGHLLFQSELGAHMLAWSPDSQRVAWTAWPQGEESPYVYLMELKRLEPQRVAKTDAERGVAWSPDSHKLAFINALDDPGEYALGILDGASQSLQCFPIEGEDTVGKFVPDTPTWSPDSQHIAYNSLGHEHIYVLRVNESSPRCLTGHVWQKFEEDERFASFTIAKPAWQPGEHP